MDRDTNKIIYCNKFHVYVKVSCFNRIHLHHLYMTNVTTLGSWYITFWLIAGFGIIKVHLLTNKLAFGFLRGPSFTINNVVSQ